MTAKEAIERIKRTPLYRYEGCLQERRQSDLTKALLLAIEALEKQIPKKVIFEDDGDSLLCQNCGLDLMGSITDPDHDPYYCFECGQALYWSEQNE